MFVSTVVAILVPRFPLLAAVGDRTALLGTPLAMTAAAGGEQTVGEVSGAAEAFGIRPGMRLSEALARCPELRLVAPNPDRTAQLWEALVRRLEGIGAAVESERPGEAFFEADGLEGIYGGRLEGVVARTRKVVGIPVRLGVAASRFCAYVAATRTHSRKRTALVAAGTERSYLAPLPVALLGVRPELSELPAALTRLGIDTLGALAALPPAAVADRFGRLGLRARELALGGDTPLRPRVVHQVLSERIELPEAASGPQLTRMLGLLIDRLLANPERRGRTLRKLALSATLAERGGTWQAAVTLRQASADADRLRLLLTPRLFELPAPVEELCLRTESLGPPGASQLGLGRSSRREGRRRLSESFRQLRATIGADSILRVVEVDPTSSVPERRALLTPFPDPDKAP